MSRDDLHDERVVGHPLGERAVVLSRQHRRRHEHGHLPPLLDDPEGRPHGQLGLAVAHVAAQQPVHRPVAGHVGVYLPHRGELVLRLAVDELALELLQPVAAPVVALPRRGVADGLDAQQLAGHLLDRLGHAPLAGLPARAPQVRERRVPPPGADVLLNQVGLRHRHVEQGVVGEAEREELLLPPLLGEHPEALELGYAAGDVDDVVALVEVDEAVDGPARADPPQPPGAGVAMEDLVMPDHHQPLGRPVEAAIDVPDARVDPLAQDRVGRGEKLLKAVPLGGVLAVHPDLAAAAEVLQLFQRRGRVHLQPLQRAYVQANPIRVGLALPRPAKGRHLHHRQPPRRLEHLGGAAHRLGRPDAACEGLGQRRHLARLDHADDGVVRQVLQQAGGALGVGVLARRQGHQVVALDLYG